VEFEIQTNPGSPFAPLSKIASGGELSRVSLAIQLTSTHRGQTPTLIFDEVDSGIGGGVAERIGQKLRQLGQTTQILCVTHLPQVASQGHHHFKTEKHQDSLEQETVTRITDLNTEDRISEIARMLGGLEITQQTLAHAREMVSRPTTSL
jgi:DNA repair protein RecN (Recombination protein N)